jgi:hypothetical protein
MRSDARGRKTYTEDELVHRLHEFEREHGMRSEDFFARWEAGEFPFTDVYFSWAGLCGRLGIPAREFA